jgi:uncharacterized membrane protein
LLLSTSLALKQLAIFIVPLYLIAVWQGHERNRLRELAVAAALIASVPLATSLPFLLWDAEGFTKSIFFSATRDAMSHVNAPCLDGYFGWIGITTRLPMVLVLALTYLLAWRRVVGVQTASLLAMVTFLCFNPVLFLQYFCWAVPLVPLAVAECITWPYSPRGSAA